MRKNSPPPLLLSLITVIVIAALLLIGWGVLKSLPTWQLARLPQFVQEWVIPAPASAILPTVSVAEGSSALLQPGSLPTVTPHTAGDPVVAATPTLAPSLAERTPVPAPALLPPPPAPESPAPLPPPVVLPESVRLGGITHAQQDWNNCGPATLAMALSFFGESYTQVHTADYVKPNAEDRNVTPAEMAAFVNRRTGQRALDRVNGDLELLKRLLAADFPVILEVGLDPPGEVAWLEWYGHYLLAAGYDEAQQQLWVYDSLVWDAASLVTQNSPDGRPYPYAELLTYWPQFNNAYIVLYTPEREGELNAILGVDRDVVGMWERSLEVNRARLLADESNAFFWFNLGSSYNSLGRHAEAATAFDKARSIGLPWRMLWYQFGPYEAYYNIGRYVDIILLADTTLQGRPFFEESFFWRGMAHKALGDLTKARADFTAANRFNPNFSAAAEALAALD